MNCLQCAYKSYLYKSKVKCKECANKWYWYIIEGEDNIVFLSLDDAIKYDMKHNPEYHLTKNMSLDRVENNISDVVYEDLISRQKEYVHYLEAII